MSLIKSKANIQFSYNEINFRLIFFIICAALFFIIFTTENSYANDSRGVGRIRSCSSSGDVENLKFDKKSGESRDFEFVMDNPVCFALYIEAYITVKGAVAAMSSACGNEVSLRVTPSPVQDLIDIAKAYKKLALNPSNSSCATSIGLANSALAAFIGQVYSIYSIADSVYDNTKLCGANWTKADPKKYTMSTPNYKQSVANAIQNYIENEETASLSFNNKTFREWYYGGVEVEDNPSRGDICRDPTQALSADNYPRQKYYLKGSEAGNFNCKKYQIFAGQKDPLTGEIITSERVKDFKKAFDCCKKRSREYVCIDFSHDASSSNSKVFCQSGTNCILSNEGLNITFAAKSVNNGQFICAESYSLCPYNFAVGGGGETCNYYQDGTWDESAGIWRIIKQEDVENGNCSNKSEIRNSDCTYNDKAGQCKNYCQYMTHCTKANDSVYTYESSLNSPYFATACFDFIGDSRNEISYDVGFLPGSQRHFSAPIAQCVKETMENVFYNRFGHSRCISLDEFPTERGVCISGNYISFNGTPYHKGQSVMNKSFFETLQNNIQIIIKITLSMSIMFYGVKILLGMSGYDKKEVLMYLIKFGLVIYFATSNAWQTLFFDGVYNASSVLSEIVFKISVSSDATRRDGCQFGSMTFADGTEQNITSAARSYPEGKEYLALWDTLDCKIARYLGFGPEASVANIALLILSGFFTGPWGLYFAMSLMFFGFFLIATAIRALHIFLSSCMAIILLVYISPFTITTSLFGKTSNIFKGWLSQLIGFCLQPMILFAYIAVFITIFDQTMIGSATFHGSGTSKVIKCKEYCVNSTGSKVSSSVDPECDDLGNKIVNPNEDSIACMINLDNFGKFPGLELIGITIPILVDFFTGDVKAKIITLVKGALVMYLLFKFMDDIPGIASYLMGGSGLNSGGSTFDKAMKYYKQALNMSRAIQKRGVGASQNAVEEGSKIAGEISRGIGSKGEKGDDST